MDIAKFSITHKVITWMLVSFCVFGGYSAYQNISRFEDPEYTIKDALVVTYYPGASPKEVEEEVTDKIAIEIQKMPQIKRLTSVSRPGYSKITVTIQDKYDKSTLPQVWNVLRSKVRDVQGQLPPGVLKSTVFDDYGDVFGMFFSITGKDYSYQEIKKIADNLKKQLLLVKGVAKINVAGIRQEAIFVEISNTKIAQLGISLSDIYSILKSQNLVAESGHVKVGNEYIEIRPTGSISSVKDIGNLVIRSQKSKALFHLSDIASIKRDYIEVPKEMNFHNGDKALTIGVSVIAGGNVVEIGGRVIERLKQLNINFPAGIEFHSIYNQPKMVDASVKAFVINLVAAIIIVLVVLILFMGLQSGLIISALLFLIVFGTLYIMNIFGIALERISLGALVIALGMLVDNAIVVVEGILIQVQKGVDKIKAASNIVNQTQWPLLGATLVGILAFAPIGLSQDSTGEYCRSLFSVITISLLLSWYFAIAIAPLFCSILFKKSSSQDDNHDPYAGKIFKVYKSFLILCLRNKIITILVAVSMLAAAIFGFGYIKSGFFPNSTTPLFYIDYWKAEGSDIRTVRDDMLKISNHIKGIKSVNNVDLFVGQGASRFMLSYTPESENSSYGQFMINVKDYNVIPKLSEQLKKYIASNFPGSEAQARFIALGPSGGSKIEVRFSGPDTNKLREIASKAQEVMYNTPNAIDIRDDWRHRVKIIEPIYSEAQGRLTGITRAQLSDALKMSFSGNQVGLYRERDELIPIISRPPDLDRLNIDSIESIYIWSELLSKTVPLGQMVSHFNTKWEDNIIARRNRLRTLTVKSDPAPGIEASVVFNSMRGKIEAIKLPPNYFMEWGGEHESSRDAQAGLSKNIPMGLLAMIVIVIILFNAVKQPLIIWSCVPLAIIGVTIGLLITNQPFDFMAILGFLSLTGMLIKNAIVLIDQIDLEIYEGKDKFNAIVDSAVSRLRPVMLAAITTVLGMLPLLTDAFFKAMAVVIMFGLSFATVLTLIMVPVLYAFFFKAKELKATPSSSFTVPN